MPRFTNRPLGALELAVMETLWRRSPASVRDVGEALAERGLAYNTLMTTLDRLYKKGLLEREKQSHAFYYRPVMDRETYERHLVANVLESLPTASHEAMLTGFLDFATAVDDTTLDTLERLIAERKRGEA